MPDSFFLLLLVLLQSRSIAWLRLQATPNTRNFCASLGLPKPQLWTLNALNGQQQGLGRLSTGLQACACY
jgi:hypothetical protein